MVKNRAVGLLLGAVLAIPLGDSAEFFPLKFNKIPANQVTHQDGRLRIKVDKSSSPLIYKFKDPVFVEGLKVEASWEGVFQALGNRVQGQKKADDFVLKVGLIAMGAKTLGWWQKKLAANWVLQLNELALKGAGVDKVWFYSTTQQKELLGQKREHPLSDLLHEERVLHLDRRGDFKWDKKLEVPLKSLGLWISADGDDTQSSFEVEIKSIEVATVERP